MSSSRSLIAIALAAAASAAACADFSRGPASPAVDAGASADASPSDGAATSFATSVHPLLIASCQRCHSAGAEAGDTQFLLAGDTAADYATVMRLINTAAPSASRLLAKASGNGHGGGTVLAAGSQGYEAVLEWIQQGALP